MTKQKIKVLFFAEAVTLAHVARPYVLASMLDAERFEVHFAHHPRYRSLLGDLPFTEHEIDSIEPQQFMAALARGKPLYSVETLRHYVAADLALIEKVRPDVVVGDFRLSLAVSTQVRKVPYITLSNAYWCPYTTQKYTVPELPIVKVLGPVIGQWLFDLVRPIAFYLHTRPLNKLRKEYGLPGLGGNLLRIYTWADHTLYVDIPDLYTTKNLPDNHHFIGPILWSPLDSIPPWWGDVPEGKPIIFVSLGSSGNAGLLPQIIAVLAELEVTGIVSTAGAEPPANPYNNIFMAKFLPGNVVASLASLVICNGGSPTTQQALSCGKPVIGIPGNLDQYLNMQALAAYGAGMWLRGDRLDSLELTRVVEELLENQAYSAAATKIAMQFARYESPSLFRQIVESAALS